MPNQQQLVSFQSILPSVEDCWRATGVPPEMTVAQWALESAWGEKSPGNNCFGIKDYPGSLGRQLLWTIEWFTPDELAGFLKNFPGRTAQEYPLVGADPRGDGRKRYRCQDWFATFPTIADCFKKRAMLFLSSRYRPILQQYQQDGDLVKFIRDTAKIYATADSDTYTNVVKAIISTPEIQSALADMRRKWTLK